MVCSGGHQEELEKQGSIFDQSRMRSHRCAHHTNERG